MNWTAKLAANAATWLGSGCGHTAGLGGLVWRGYVGTHIIRQEPGRVRGTRSALP
jgi:hypothetical protein